MLFIFSILAVGGVLFFAQLPILFGFRAKSVAVAIKQAKLIELSGKTLFVSDFQLRYSDIDKRFPIDVEGVKYIVIVGDLFDSPGNFSRMGNTDEERLQKALATFVPENFSGDIYFVWGHTHDPFLEKSVYQVGNKILHFLGEYGSFNIQGIPVLIFHGHQLHGGLVGGGVSWLLQRFGYSLVLERLGRKKFEISNDTWIINAHSHVPAIDQRAKIANTGSFVGAPFNFFFRLPIGTGVVFDTGDVQLLKFQGVNREKFYGI